MGSFILPSSSSSSSSTIATHLDKRETRSTKKRALDQQSAIENDEIRLGNNPHSVGTIIKRAAFKVHDEMLNDNNLTLRHRKIMTNGLSSILDIVDNSFASQRSLFKEGEWQELKILFNARLFIAASCPRDKVEDVITIVSATLGLNGDYKRYYDLINREIERSNSLDKAISLKHTFGITESYPHMQTKSH